MEILNVSVLLKKDFLVTWVILGGKKNLKFVFKMEKV